MPWISSGRVAAPAAGAVLCDTGPLAAGVVSIDPVIAGTLATVCELQHRSADNTVTIASQILACPANSMSPPWRLGNLNLVEEGERVRIVTVTAPGAGSQVSASIGLG